MTVGERIKAARVAAKFTQKDLADILDVHFTWISQYERGIRNPKPETLERIADALDTTQAYLKGEGEAPTQIVLRLHTPYDREFLKLYDKKKEGTATKEDEIRLNELTEKVTAFVQQKKQNPKVQELTDKLHSLSEGELEQAIKVLNAMFDEDNK